MISRKELQHRALVRNELGAHLMTDEDIGSLHSIDTRLQLVERELREFAGTKNWIRSISVLLLVQLIAFAVGYGQLSNQVSVMNLSELEKSSATSLQVLADHGTELAGLRNELAAQRGVTNSMRDEMAERTADRFTGRDGDRLARSVEQALESMTVRVQRLEDIIYAQD